MTLFYSKDDANIINGAAFASMWFHGSATDIAISTQNLFTKIIIFVNDGYADGNGNVIPDATTGNDLTFAMAGIYSVHLEMSITNGGAASKEFLHGIAIILGSVLTITDATNATPIVVTTDAAHGLKTGDGVRIVDVVGNTAANGDFWITRLGANTFSLQTFAFADIVGNGAYSSGGTVPNVYPGNITIHHEVSNTDIGRGAASGDISILTGDVVEGWVANLDGTDNLSVRQIEMAAMLTV